MSKPLIILGAGGHAKVVLSLAQELDLNVQCLTDSDKSKHGENLLGVKIVGGDEILEDFNPREFDLAMGIAVGSDGNLVAHLKKRYEIFRGLVGKGYSFPPLIHPNAWVAKESKIGTGVQVISGAIIQPGCSIGDLSIINTKASIDHDTLVGVASHIAPGVTGGGGVRIGATSHIGIGATLLPNIEIGEESMVAAGALVIHDLPKKSRVAGIPAKGM